MVNQQEALNRLYESIRTIQNEEKRKELSKKFEETAEEWRRLWEYC